jgi:invasion protein IalB
MTKTLLALLASIAIVSAAAPAPSEAAQAKFKRITNPKSTFEKKAGYWVECYYSALGQQCEYVYARVRTANGIKLRRIKANSAKFSKKAGYWVECYYSALGQQCEYVYARPRK